MEITEEEERKDFLKALNKWTSLLNESDIDYEKKIWDSTEGVDLIIDITKTEWNSTKTDFEKGKEQKLIISINNNVRIDFEVEDEK